MVVEIANRINTRCYVLVAMMAENYDNLFPCGEGGGVERGGVEGWRRVEGERWMGGEEWRERGGVEREGEGWRGRGKGGEGGGGVEREGEGWRGRGRGGEGGGGVEREGEGWRGRGRGGEGGGGDISHVKTRDSTLVMTFTPTNTNDIDRHTTVHFHLCSHRSS